VKNCRNYWKLLIKPIKGTRIHGNTSYEPLTTFLRRTMRSRHDVLFNFGSLFPKFGCHGNSLGSLEILDSIFEIAVPEKPNIHAKFVSKSCTEMKLCLFECLAYLYHCAYRQFSRFLRKNSRNCWKFLIKPIKGTRIHGNTFHEPLTTFLRRTMRSRQDVLFNFGSFFSQIWLPWQLPWLPWNFG